MNTLEDRLRDAYRAAAETVRPEEILPGAILSPPDHARRRARRTGRTGPGPSRIRVLIPLAAAVAVITVAAVVAVLLPRAAPGLGRGKPTAGQTTPALLTTPAYFVVLNWSQHPSMFVANATTGAQGARISLPFPATDLVSVATGDGQTFVVAATAPEGCTTTLYRFSLAANGTPSPMTPFTNVAGQISDPWDMAVSAGSRFIAYQTMACSHLSPEQLLKAAKHGQTQRGHLSVLNTVTGRTKQWTYQTRLNEFLPGTGNVSISANGSVVGFSNKVIDTSAPAGSLAAHARVVATNGEFGPSTIIGGLNVSPDGTNAYFETFRDRQRQAGVEQLAAPGLRPGYRADPPGPQLPWHGGRAGRRHVRPNRPLHAGRVRHQYRVGHGAPADHEAGRGRRRDRAADPAERELGRRPGDRLVARPGYPGKRRLPTAEVTLSAATAPPDHAAPHRARRPSIAAPLPAISSRSASPS